MRANAIKINDPNSLESAFSSDVKISIDTQKPQFDKNNIKVQLNNKLSNNYFVEGVFSSDTVTVKAVSGTIEILLEKKSDIMFSGNISLPENSTGFVLFAYDHAGNDFSVEIKLSDQSLSQQINNVLSTPSATQTSSINFTTKQIVNAVIGISLLILFIVDSIVVWKTGKHAHKNLQDVHKGIIKQKETGSGLHHIIPILIVIAAILTTTTFGNIL